MFANLIAKEVVNGIKGGRVVCPDHDACSSRQFLIGVVDFFVQALHSVCARPKSVVHNHGNLKVARSKGGSDAVEVLANLSKSHGVLRVVGLNLDGAAIGLFVVLHSCQKKQI